MSNLNLLGSYICKRIQKDNPIKRYTHAREYLTGLYINANDIQRYIYDYFIPNTFLNTLREYTLKGVPSKKKETKDLCTKYDLCRHEYQTSSCAV